MSIYSIKDLEHLSGIKSHTIRIWEQRYDLFSPERSATNIRSYKDKDLKLILQIASLQSHSFKISKIVKMTDEEREEEVRKISFADDSFDNTFHAMTVAMLDLDEIYFKRIIESYIIKIGFEQTMINILYPFLNRIGILWMTGSINPAHEHFISHLIRERLISATAELEPPSKGPLFALILPEDELHELGLLFARYMLTVRRIRTLFLGQVVPLSALREVSDTVDIDHLLICITTNPSPAKIQDYVNNVGRYFPKTQTLITGPLSIASNPKLPSNMKLIRDFKEFSDLIEEEIMEGNVIESD